MRKLLYNVVFFLLITNVLFAQSSPDTTHSQRFILDGHRYTDDAKKAIVVLNGLIIQPNQINTINPSSILSIDILKGSQATQIYGLKAIYGALVITTKKYAILAYQKTLSSFSIQYKKYLHENNYNDKRLTYFFKDGTVLIGGKAGTVERLYKIKKADIDSVVFWMHEDFSGIKMYTVNVKTKS